MNTTTENTKFELYAVGQLVVVTAQNGDEYDAEVREVHGEYYRLEVEVADKAKHQFWTVHEIRMASYPVQIPLSISA